MLTAQQQKLLEENLKVHIDAIVNNADIETAKLAFAIILGNTKPTADIQHAFNNADIATDVDALYYIIRFAADLPAVQPLIQKLSESDNISPIDIKKEAIAYLNIYGKDKLAEKELGKAPSISISSNSTSSNAAPFMSVVSVTGTPSSSSNSLSNSSPRAYNPQPSSSSSAPSFYSRPANRMSQTNAETPEERIAAAKKRQVEKIELQKTTYSEMKSKNEDKRLAKQEKQAKKEEKKAQNKQFAKQAKEYIKKAEASTSQQDKIENLDAAIKAYLKCDRKYMSTDRGNGSRDISFIKICRKLAVIYKTRGELQKATNCYSIITQLSRDNDAFFNLGNLHMSLGNHKEAIKSYNKIFLSVTESLGVTLKIGHMKLALTELDVPIAELKAKANDYKQSNDYPNEILCRNAIIKLLPHIKNSKDARKPMFTAYNELADAYERIGDNANAIATYNHIRYLTEDYNEEGTALYNIGAILHKNHDYKNAIGYYESSINDFYYGHKSKINIAQAYYNIGLCHIELDDPKKALHALTTAMKKGHPEDTTSLREDLSKMIAEEKAQLSSSSKTWAEKHPKNSDKENPDPKGKGKEKEGRS
ncbi:MAG: hypothetical protein K0R98_1645 [Rickettsiaceae bacterium]|jgi:tetratricopeptide (TPR) repeat protein|nr:hypothetical protein [Rickettsiaceae bacterium]